MHGSFDTLEQEVVLSVLSTNDQYQHRFGQFFRSHGLTESQFNVLWLLGRAGEPLPVLEVGRRLLTEVPGVTRLVDGLGKRGFVKRKQSETDRRVWHVHLTKAGKALLNTMHKPNLAMHRTLVGHLSKKECRQLVALLAKARAANNGKENQDND